MGLIPVLTVEGKTDEPIDIVPELLIVPGSARVVMLDGVPDINTDYSRFVEWLHKFHVENNPKWIALR